MPRTDKTRASNKLSRLVVRRRFDTNEPWAARLHFGGFHVRAALGRAGVTANKREGDGKSPVGSYALRPGFIRKDRFAAASLLPLKAARPGYGWCDAPGDRLYNRPAPAGYPASHERLWREDGVYDVVIPTSHNERPRISGRGSAIFFHLARQLYPGTEGCVAIARDDMRRLLPRLGRRVRLVISP